MHHRSFHSSAVRRSCERFERLTALRDYFEFHRLACKQGFCQNVNIMHNRNILYLDEILNCEQTYEFCQILSKSINILPNSYTFIKTSSSQICQNVQHLVTTWPMSGHFYIEFQNIPAANFEKCWSIFVEKIVTFSKHFEFGPVQRWVYLRKSCRWSQKHCKHECLLAKSASKQPRKIPLFFTRFCAHPQISGCECPYVQANLTALLDYCNFHWTTPRVRSNIEESVHGFTTKRNRAV